MSKQLFDEWPERYDRWFETPVGKAVLRYEGELILDLLRPARGERLLDAGSGTGIFTRKFAARGAEVVGLDISFEMLVFAARHAALRPAAGDAGPRTQGGRHLVPAREGKANTLNLQGDQAGMSPEPEEKVLPLLDQSVAADMTNLPFADGAFDKSVSVAALEFIADEKRAVAELFRVTKSGGAIVVATLNSLSPWAARRSAKARRDPESIFNRVFFRSPLQLLAAAPVAGIVRTAVHFGQEDDPAAFDRIERQGGGLDTGAFVAARWVKP